MSSKQVTAKAFGFDFIFAFWLSLLLPLVHHQQVIITSTLDCNLGTILIQDLLTGTNLRVFKEGIICSHNCLDLVADQYLMVGHKDVPLIHFWSLNTKITVKLKMKCPASPSALAITPDGLYAVIALGEKIYIYMVCTNS